MAPCTRAVACTATLGGSSHVALPVACRHADFVDALAEDALAEDALAEDAVRDVAEDVGKAEVSAGMAIGQTLVIEAQRME